MNIGSLAPGVWAAKATKASGVNDGDAAWAQNIIRARRWITGSDNSLIHVADIVGHLQRAYCKCQISADTDLIKKYKVSTWK